MAEARESSGLTSLAALREHETRRIVRQTEAPRARAEAEQRARLESERELERLAQERQRSERAASESLEAQRQAELSRFETARASQVERAERATRERDELQVLLAEELGARRAAELTIHDTIAAPTLARAGVDGVVRRVLAGQRRALPRRTETSGRARRARSRAFARRRTPSPHGCGRGQCPVRAPQRGASSPRQLTRARAARPSRCRTEPRNAGNTPKIRAEVGARCQCFAAAVSGRW